MPKREVFHRAGEPIDGPLRTFLGRHFAEEDLEKLERLGGRVLISVAAPYAPKKKQVTLDKEFLGELESASDDPDRMDELLAKLSRKDLRSLGEELGMSFRSSATRVEMRQELVTFLQSEHIWDRIVG